MSDVIYPTLDLFLYDLRNGLGDTETDLEENRAHFQKKLPEGERDRLFQYEPDLEVEYAELLKPRVKQFKDKESQYPVEGYYYPVRFGDSYGLLLDCSVSNQIDAQPATCLAALKAEIEKRLNGEPATIGQTWMISGWLPDNSKSSEETAKACYKALMPDGGWEEDLQGQGLFLGAAIFELSRYRLAIAKQPTSPTGIQSIQEYQHVIIVLYPDRATAEKAARFYSDWMRLFYYRHKIVWCYGQSRWLKQAIKNKFSTIQSNLQSLQQENTRRINFEKIRGSLGQVQDTANFYNLELMYLDFQGRSIEINLGNYDKRRQSMEKKAEAASDLNFLEDFSSLAGDKYLLQIKKDFENLTQGWKLLEHSLNMLNSRIGVETATRDNNFRTTVTIIGVALSAHSAAFNLSKEFPAVKDSKKALQHPVGSFLHNSLGVPEEALPPSLSLMFGLSAAAIATLLASGFIWQRLRSR